MPSKVPPSLVREREIRAREMVAEGKSQYVIAEALEITQPAVSQILKRVWTRRLKVIEKDLEQRKILHSDRLDYVYGQAIAAWIESKKPRQKSRSRKTITPFLNPSELLAAAEGEPILKHHGLVREETLKEAMTSEGDPAHLLVALKADEEQRKLWGINAPKQIDLLDKRRPLEQLPDDELAKRAAANAAEIAALEGGK